MNSIYFLFKTIIRPFIALIIIILITVNDAYSQSDTLYPSGIIKPFDIPDNMTVFSSFHDGTPVGDINSDGFTDFALKNNSGVQYNETYLVIDIQNPLQAKKITATGIKGIGDYNGDGFDDMIAESDWRIYFGNAAADNFETVQLPYNGMDYILRYHADLNGDGKTEIVYTRDSQNNDSLFVMSFGFSEPKLIDFPSAYIPRMMLFNNYDYDNDGQKELFVSIYESDRYKYGWFVFDSIADMYVYESVKYRLSEHDPSVHFTVALCDLNGDGLKDICHDFYESDVGFHVEVYFGTTEAPFYFDHPITIEAHNTNRLFYSAGDINNDGADDWYSTENTDTIVIYYGSVDIALQGQFNKSYHVVGDNKLMVPSSKYSSIISAQQPEIFDYNNDGTEDIYFNYWTFDENGRYEICGMAIIEGGEIPGFDTPEILGINASESNFKTSFGDMIKNTGDFNHDGYDDWAILSQVTNEMNLYYGGEILDFTPDLTILLPQYPYVKSYDMAFGDLNNNGWVDIVISNSSSSDINLIKTIIDATETVYFFSGGADLADTLYRENAVKIWDAYNEIIPNHYSFGISLSIPGDYNADGIDDLVVKSSKQREAFIFYGGEQLADDPDETITVYCSGYSTKFAVPITACGDLNNDGYDDFTLGDAPNGKGKSLIYYGGPLADNQYDLVLNNSDTNGRLFGGSTPTTKGDFSDDGYPDLAQWNYTINSLQIYFGGPDFDDQIDISLSDTSLSVFLSCIEYINDFSKKGKADILVSDWSDSEKLLYMFYGTDQDKQQADLVFHNTLGRPIGVASGDFNKDGYVDIFAGHTDAVVDGKVSSGLVQHYISPTMTGIEENKTLSDYKLMLMPNPASHTLNVHFKTQNVEDVIIMISDINGRKLSNKTGQSNQTEVFDISLFPSGIYFVSVVCDKIYVTRKLIKQ